MSHGFPRWMVTAVASDEAAFRTAIGAGTGGAEIADGAVTEAKLAAAVVSTINAKASATHMHPASEISDSTAAGRTLLTAADAAAQRTALGVSASPTGTPDGTKYLRDDNTWQPVSGGSGLTQPQVMARSLGC